MFLWVGKASFLRCHCSSVWACHRLWLWTRRCFWLFFLNGSWLCVLERKVAVALETSRCSHSSPPESACRCPSCLPVQLVGISGSPWWRTLQEQLPANGNYFKTNWCGFSVKPTWSINKVGLELLPPTNQPVWNVAFSEVNMVLKVSCHCVCLIWKVRVANCPVFS